MKKILISVAIIAIAVVASFNVNFHSQENSLAEIGLANVEALADGESGNTYDCCDSCTGAYCGTFTAADTGKSYKVYYK